MMKFDILTLFPSICAAYFGESILKRAQVAGLIDIVLHNIRDYATDKHRTTDDTPFGGGGGMVMKAEPLLAAIRAACADAAPPVILMSPQGRVFTQQVAQELAAHPHLVLVCGRYEGVDERVLASVITDEISLGDYVLTGGELPAMAVVDAVARLIPGVLGAEHGAAQDSHATGLLEHPHYTRPAQLEGRDVPAVLLEGHHARVAAWRRQESLRRTWQRRPDLLLTATLNEAEQWFLQELAEETIIHQGGSIATT